MKPTDPERQQAHAALLVAHDIAVAALAGGVEAILAAVGACHQSADRLWGDARAAGSDPAAEAACAAGCGWCCHQPVEASTVEVLAIAARLRIHPDIAALRARLGAWSGGRICPFLTNGTCAIYSFRPLKCRGLYQPDPRWCMATFAKIDPPEDGSPICHRAFTLPRTLFDAVGQGLTRPLHRAGLDCAALDFAPALKAVLDRPDAAAAWARGDALFPDRVRFHGWIERDFSL
ncbi:YkgJ family cysteine cluster protein [Magnetospirillum molischianum]|nr:YkgJ family cysteine cluster protein [Magnetospirillum molischianum]